MFDGNCPDDSLIDASCLTETFSDILENFKPPNKLKQKLDQLDEAYLLNSAVLLGYKLGLFQKMAEITNNIRHATPEEIAEHAKCKTRYVKEWLAIMSSADIIEVDSEDKYWVLLKRELHSSPSACLINTDVYPKLVECVKEDGPLGLISKDYNWYKRDLDDPCDHVQFLDDVRRICEASLNEELFIRLQKGNQMVLEVGCGSGAHSAVFASLFPNNMYTGIDIDPGAIRVADQRMKTSTQPFKNLRFICCDATELYADWEGAYDLIFIHFSTHDMARPDKCFEQCFKVLNTGGTLIMIDSACPNTMYENKRTFGRDAVLPFCISFFQCLPLSSSAEDSLALGSMCPKDKFIQLLTDAGFVHIRLRRLAKMPPNTSVYTCYKEHQIVEDDDDI